MSQDKSDDLYDKFVNGVPDEKAIDEMFSQRATRHADDAIDYEDIDELADDLPEEEPAHDSELHDGDVAADDNFDDIFDGEDDGLDNLIDDHDRNNLFNNLDHTGLEQDHDGLPDLNMMYDEDSQDVPAKRKALTPGERQAKKQKLAAKVAKLEARLNKKRMKYLFPNYHKSKPYNHYYSNMPDPQYYSYQRSALAFKENIKPLIPTKLSLEVDVDQRKAFKSRKVDTNSLVQRHGIVSTSAEDLELVKELQANSNILFNTIPFLRLDGTNNDRFAEFDKDLLLSTTDWNDEDIINAGDSKQAQVLKVKDRLLNSEYDHDDESIFSGQIASTNFKLDMNDPHLLFIRDSLTNKKAQALMPTSKKMMEMKFNVSNDKEYDFLKSNYNTKVRSQLSNLNIEHSVPALRLQGPYYKVKLSKEECRAFHRGKFVVRPGSLMSFSKLKVRKKKKDKGRSPQEIFAKTTDLTTTDSGTLIGMEYSEEYPLILNNFGMASKLINYYRKEKEDDNSRPKAPLGETHVLGVEDRSPFWNFGHVAKGDFVPTLYNNMFRAPIFKHNTRSTDFLLIRSQGAGNHPRHYLRAMDHLFSVGQTFPAVEVPAPHSRKVTNTFKNRLKMVVFRIMNKNGMARISVKDVSQHFPDQNDMQNRQRLKEFMEYQRGEDKGYWKIRGSSVVPSEDKIRTMITPEDASLLDSMQHGQQVVDDHHSLYNNDDSKKPETKKEKEKKKDQEDDEKPRKRDRDREDLDEDVEEELAPWNATRNFINSNQTKSMLQLNGEGDHTGIGLGFSLLRSTQRNTFLPLFQRSRENVPKNNTAAYQQKLYEAEVSRIWYAQRRSLTVDNQEGHTLDSIYNEYKPLDHDEFLKHKIAEDRRLSGEKTNVTNVLRITRRFRDKNNIVQRRTEVVYDPRLIKAYIKRKKQIEGDKMSMADVGDIIPTNDMEVNKIRKKALQDKIASLQKRAKLSKGRKSTNAKDPLHAAAAAGGTIIDANTVMLPDGTYAIGGKGIGKGKSLNRRCNSCGAFGHIRTNKACPLYVVTQGGTIPIAKELKENILAEHAKTHQNSSSPTPSSSKGMPLGSPKSLSPQT